MTEPLAGTSEMAVLRVSSVLSRYRRAVQVTFLFAVVLYLWTKKGTLKTVHNDSKLHLLLSQRMNELNQRVEQHCERKERQGLLQLDIWNKHLTKKGEEAGEDEKDRALREWILRSVLVNIRDLNQMWCLVPKAASFSWSKVLVRYLHSTYFQQPGRLLYMSRGKPKVTYPQGVLKFMYNDSSVFENAAREESVKKVLLIRHPFARLVSAYEDKLKNRSAKPDSMYFFRKYGLNISREYRGKNGLKSTTTEEPTFEEFIEYLLHTDPLKYDEHWQPISLLCALCNVKYHHIIRQEDLKASSSFHLRELGFPPEFRVSHENPSYVPSHNNAHESHHHGNLSHFSSIPRVKMLKLYRIYQDDFEMFDYHFL